MPKVAYVPKRALFDLKFCRRVRMIVSEGILAKIVGFIAQKSAGKIYGLATDKRKKACRSLTKLYYSVQKLDEVTEGFFSTFTDFEFQGDGYALVNAVNNHSSDIELASNMFIDLSRELEQGLRIIDPALAKCCHLLYWGKFDFLNYMSTSVGLHRSEGMLLVSLKTPKDAISAVDMQAMYRDSEQEGADADKFYWPDSAFDDFSNQFDEVVLSSEGPETASKLIGMLKTQNSLLKEAKESLRVLLKDNFSIEEILFQSDSHPYR
jgi:hypothetical protein